MEKGIFHSMIVTSPVLKRILLQGRGDVVIVAQPDCRDVSRVEAKYITKFPAALEQFLYRSLRVDVKVADEWKADIG